MNVGQADVLLGGHCYCPSRDGVTRRRGVWGGGVGSGEGVDALGVGFAVEKGVEEGGGEVVRTGLAEAEGVGGERGGLGMRGAWGGEQEEEEGEHCDGGFVC